MAEQKTIIIAPEDPQILIAFKKHRLKFIALLQSGVFDLDSGQANININNGQIQNIFINQMTYKRDTKFDNIPI